jgi:hypothetical protein
VPLAALCPDHLAIGISGFDNSDVLIGRSYGECAFFWRRDCIISKGVVRTGSNRVSAMRAVVDNVPLMLCVRGQQYQLRRLQHVAVKSVFEQNLNRKIILGGDFIVDFSRRRSHSSLLSEVL